MLSCEYLADFGMAQHLSMGDHADSFRGSPLYMVWFLHAYVLCTVHVCVCVCMGIYYVYVESIRVSTKQPININGYGYGY